MGAPVICDDDTLDASYVGSGNAPSVFGSAWVPAGASANFNASGEVLPSYYWTNGRAEYKIYARVLDPETGSQLWSDWNYYASPVEWGSGPYTWQPFSNVNIGTWTNTTGAGKSFAVETWAERTYAGAGINWGVNLTVGGPLVPCELQPDEADVPNDAEPNSCGAQPGAADPVNVVQGNYWDSWTDLEIPGRGPGLSLRRTYSSSRAAVTGPLGFGWNHAYGMSVVEAAGIATVRQESGAVVRFAADSGLWVTASRVNASLVRQVDGTWTFTRHGVEVFRFSSSGTLTSIADLSGNTTTLAYSGGVLASVTDASGRSLSFTWQGGRIATVTAPSTALDSGQSPTALAVAYGYDGAGNLATVTDTAGGVDLHL